MLATAAAGRQTQDSRRSSAPLFFQKTASVLSSSDRCWTREKWQALPRSLPVAQQSPPTQGAMDADKEDGGAVVAAILVNRAKEVGLAALDLAASRLHLHLLIETSRAFHNTTNLLQFYRPSTVLVVQGPIGEMPLAHADMSQINKVTLPRSFFRDEKGAALLEELALPDDLRSVMQAPCLPSACAAAIVRWLELESNVKLHANSLKVTINGSLDHLQVDYDSLVDLDIMPADATAGRAKGSHATLLSILDNAVLESGSKLLKANLLQPLKDASTINMRLDCLEEVLSNEALFAGIQAVMKRFPSNLDRTLLSFSYRRNEQSGDNGNQVICRRISVLVSGIILLKEALAVFPDLAQILDGTRSELLQGIREICSHPVVKELQEKIKQVIDNDVLHARAPFASRAQQCFAVKSGVDGFLDIARKTFCTTTEAVHALGKRYREQYGLPSLKLPFNARRGFYISFLAKEAANKALPREFTQVSKAGKNIHCTTQELTSLNSRNKEASANCYLREETCLEGLCDAIRGEISHLFGLVESVSILDVVLNCFGAFVAASTPGSFVRPELTDEGPLAIDGGRHPVLERTQQSMDYVANSTFMSPASNMLIVQGPNMSGKSTYLRQVGVICILGQVGCFVPARYASLRIIDRVFTRMGTEDSIEDNSSTFMTEMRETAHTLANLTPRSLVLVDELGRATSAVDGLCIAWSCCEDLLQSQAFTLVATHMKQLEALAVLYPNVKCCYLSVSLQRNSLHFEHLLKEGSSGLENYGLLLAQDMGMPPPVVERAKVVADKVLEQELRCFGGERRDFASLRKDYQVAQRLTCLQFSTLSEDKLRAQLLILKDSCL